MEQAEQLRFDWTNLKIPNLFCPITKTVWTHSNSTFHSIAFSLSLSLFLLILLFIFTVNQTKMVVANVRLVREECLLFRA